MSTIRSVQMWITIAALSLAPLFFGSVDLLWVAIWTTLLSIGVLCGATLPMQAGQRAILIAFLALCGAYALVAIIQVVPGAMDRLDDPIWQRARVLLQIDVLPRISSRAEIPPAAIGHLLLTITGFTSGFFVGTSRRNSDTLTDLARYGILAYALYGLAALAFTPDLLLWAPKLAYRGSLTSSFVNHNTAATFLGTGVIMWSCSALLTLQSLQLSSLRVLLLTPATERVAFELILRLGAGLICFFALLLSGSRGGLICTCLGLLVAVGLMTANRLRPGFWYALGSAVAALSVMIGWLTHVGRIGSEGMFDDGRWAVYGICLDIIRQRPLLGSGAGTFADIFPSLRPADFNSWGVWDYAHSTILEIAVEMGVPIAVLIVVASVALLRVLARAALVREDRARGSFAAITGIAVLSYTHSMIDFSLQIPGYLVVFGILLGCWMSRSAAEQTSAQPASWPGLTAAAKSGFRRRMPAAALDMPSAPRAKAEPGASEAAQSDVALATMKGQADSALSSGNVGAGRPDLIPEPGVGRGLNL